jgi:hypothetical protein
VLIITGLVRSVARPPRHAVLVPPGASLPGEVPGRQAASSRGSSRLDRSCSDSTPSP